jgi:putative ABC transport system ATP-binding protein
MITFNHVSLSFLETQVLEDLSFDVLEGENVCLTGASGRGKSSVINLIQGYLSPHSGSVIVAGMPLNRETIKTIRLRMAYIPQNINLPVYNGEELLKLLNVKENTAQVGAYIKKLGLSAEMVSKSFDEMSGGQKQRIVIAVCLSLKRDIVLLDEPTSSLDDDSVQKLINLIKSIDGKTFISASHHLEWRNSADRNLNL